MKIYIIRTREPNQYCIYKVSDHLVDDFEKERSGSIVLKAASINEALIKFGELDKEPGVEFNSELLKHRSAVKQETEEFEIARKPLRPICN